MTRRQYQFFALAILIGATLLVNVLANMLPGVQTLAQASVPVSAPAAPDYMQPVADPSADLPPAQPDPSNASTTQNAPSANGPFDAAPSVDVTGMAVQGIDPTPADTGTQAAPPSPPPPPASPKRADDSDVEQSAAPLKSGGH